MSSQTFVPGTQIKDTLYSLHFVVHPFKNIHWKKNLSQLTLIQHFMDVVWPRILCISIIKKNQVPGIIVIHIITQHFYTLCLFCVNNEILIGTLYKNLSLVFWKPFYFSTECWFQPLHIRYCILHVRLLNKNVKSKYYDCIISHHYKTFHSEFLQLPNIPIDWFNSSPVGISLVWGLGHNSSIKGCHGLLVFVKSWRI